MYLIETRVRVMLMLMLALFLSLLLVTAHAQTTADTSVNAGSLWTALLPYIAAALGTVITALIAWLAVLFQKWSGVAIDQKSRDALAAALETGVNYGLSKVGTKASTLTIDVKSQVAAAALDWVVSSVPDALKRFNLTPDDLAKMIASRIQVADPAAPSLPSTPAVVAAVVPVSGV